MRGGLVEWFVGSPGVHDRDGHATGGLEGAVGEVVEAVDDALAGEGDEGDGAFVAGFEADGGAGGDVEAVAAGGGAVEFEGGIDFEEMEVAADLDGAVAGVGDGEFEGVEADIGFEVGRVFGCDDFAGDHAGFEI